MAFWHRKKKKQNSLRAEENAQEQNLSQEVAEESPAFVDILFLQY